MKLIFTFIVFNIVHFVGFGQNEWNNWVFAEDHIFNFSAGLTATAGGVITSTRGNASISNSTGDLLFYTDGESIWDRDHNLMPNGTGLNGCNESSQSSIIVKKPGETNIYYVFTVDCRENSYANGIQYSEVDMTLNAGFGDVTAIKNVPMQTDVAEFVTVTLGPEGYWIIAHGSSDDTWYAFSFTCDGIADPVISNEGWEFTGLASTTEEEGQLKASPDGSLLAYTYYIDFGFGSGQVELLEFDTGTGVVSNAQALETYGQDAWGCEFSANGEVLYIGYLYSGIYSEFACPEDPWDQFNVILQHDVSDIASIPPPYTVVGSSCFTDNVGQFQRGPDGRIYSALTLGASIYYYIEFPEIIGAGCNFVEDVATGLPPSIGWCYPNFAPVGEADYTCGFTVSLVSDTICEGDCYDLIAEVSSGVAPYTFEWSPGILSTDDTVIVCPTLFTTYEVTVIDAIGDTATAEATITVIPAPSLDLGSDTSICVGSSLLLDAMNPGATYLWQDGSIDQTFMVDTSGEYWVQIDNGGCVTEDTIAVSMIGPTVNIGNDTLVCVFDDFILNAANPGLTYLWHDGSLLATYEVTDTGIYYVSVTDPSSGCIASDTILISLDTRIVDLGNDTVICNLETLLLDAGVSVGTYLWSDGSTDQTLLVDNSGLIWVEMTEGICVAKDTINVLFQEPIANFTADDFTGCAPEEINFTNLSTEAISWNWDFGDGTSSTIENPSHVYVSSGTYFISLTITTTEGCVSDTIKTISIDIYPTPEASFTFSPESPELGEEINFEDLSINAESWSWSFGDGGTATNQNPRHSYTDRGNYIVTLTVTNEICTDSYELIIVVEEPTIFYIPNVFTPDGDNFNEIFQPIFTAGFDPYDFHLVILNRWGEIIFESFDASKGWDGSYGDLNDEKVIDGVYVWRLDFGDINSDKKYSHIGHVTVLK
jgi:gliding motility-associated-like protein